MAKREHNVREDVRQIMLKANRPLSKREIRAMLCYEVNGSTLDATLTYLCQRDEAKCYGTRGAYRYMNPINESNAWRELDNALRRMIAMGNGRALYA